MVFRLLFLFLISHTCSAQYGALDTSFQTAPGAEEAGGTFDVLCAQLQPDGRILIGGKFTSYNGTERRCIARVLPDGSVDPSFDPGAGAQGNGVPSVEAMALLPNGKVLVAGNFTSWNGVPVGRIARLNSDGSLDPTFIPGGGANELITSLAVLPDGKILIAGAFTAFTGTFRSRIARLNANGVLDTTFDPGEGPGGTIRTILDLQVESNGRIYVGGHFQTFAGTSRNRVARLLPNGELDGTFTPGGGPNGPVFTVALLPGGRLLIGGSFTSFSGVARSRLARLNANGTLDTNFLVGTGADNVVNAILVRPDGRVMIGGDMLTYNGVTTHQLAGLLPNGAYDTSFDPGTGTTSANTRTVHAFLEQPEGRILVLGSFFEYDGQVRKGVARILPCTLAQPGTITVDPVGSCVGDAITLSMVGGALNESTEWAWYADACGGQPLGTGNTLATQAVAGITFHVRGGGGCIGNCTAVDWSPVQPNASVLFEGGILTALLDGAAYQWVDCSNGEAPIDGATDQVFVPLANGSYAVIVTLDGCSARSECVTILTVGSTDDLGEDGPRVHPNPAHDRVWIDVPTPLQGRPFVVRDATGRVAAQGLFQQGRNTLSMDHLAPGPYLLAPLHAPFFVPVRILKW